MNTLVSACMEAAGTHHACDVSAAKKKTSVVAPSSFSIRPSIPFFS
jgi:hypothetical protein